ncbi:MAG TPA: sulfite reductase subunit alpha [Xanthobacteraceae bacterium]|nr:sulfite reductase subunit alpha [Xanthobacteraceae bacterium]
MTQRPPTLSLIPESAPFSNEQRTWLSGLFAGLISLDQAVTPLSAEQAAAMMPGMLPAAEDGLDDGAPWHDQSIELPERMKLADGRPLRRRLMAAMAQQDCGQCGYNCEDYAEALHGKTEERLNLCVPGGKETARMLKSLYAELDAVPAAEARAAHDLAEKGAALDMAPEPGQSREHPVEAVFLARRRLNKPGSEKETWHLDFDIAPGGLDYVVGDSFGIYPTNDAALVATVIKALGVEPDVVIGDKTLRQVLTSGVSLSPAPDSLFQLLSYLSGGVLRQKAKSLADGQDPDGDAATLDVLAALEKFSGIRPHPEAFIEALEPLQPRLYSISSSPRVQAGRLSLTVDAVRYDIAKRRRHGVASTFLADRLSPGDMMKVYVQKAHGFALPTDPAVPIIMVGPGTGVAPFRAFLQERQATQSRGRNWLFFGHQRSDYDFFYEDEFAAMKAAGVLNRLTLAWSRDGNEKIYVQDRMRDVGRDLWAWLAEGAHVYVCGDAKRMARDVERALVDVVAAFGSRSTDAAVSYVAELKKSGRYQQDVY